MHGPKLLSSECELRYAGISDNALRICKGAGCPKASAIRFTGQPLSVRRGTIAFWVKQNNNNPTSGPTEIFSTYPGNPYVTGSFVPSVNKSVSAIANGAITTLTVPNHGLANGAKVLIKGGTGRWSVVNAIWPTTVLDADTITIPLGSIGLGSFSGSGSLLTPSSVTVNHVGYSGNYGTFASDSFFMPAGEWHHIAWSWTADRHKIYRDGNLVATYDSTSPFPYVSTLPYISLGTQQGGTQDISVDEFGSYTFDFTPQEAVALYAAKPAPAIQQGLHGVSSLATWGPGEQKIKISLDAGDYGSIVQSFRADVYSNGAVVASQTFTQTNGGFAEGLIALNAFPTGQYQVKATAFSTPGVTVGTAMSDTYSFTKPAWLGNSYGIDTSVPAAFWDAVTATGSNNLTLTVVNRTYNLLGGFGLPMQITSLGVAQLASPLSLQFVRGALFCLFQIRPSS